MLPGRPGWLSRAGWVPVPVEAAILAGIEGQYRLAGQIDRHWQESFHPEEDRACVNTVAS